LAPFEIKGRVLPVPVDATAKVSPERVLHGYLDLGMGNPACRLISAPVSAPRACAQPNIASTVAPPFAAGFRTTNGTSPWPPWPASGTWWSPTSFIDAGYR